VLVVAGVVLVAAGSLVVLHSPVFSARHVAVIGVRHTSRAAVLRAAGLVGAPPLADVDTGVAAGRVEALPWVATATVARHWPDGVVVRVTERTAVAVVAGGGEIFLVDAAGRLLQRIWTEPTGLPLLVSAAGPGRPGSVLGPAAGPGLTLAAALLRLLPGRVRAVSVGAGGAVVLDLGGAVRAVMGSAHSVDAKLAALASVLAGAPPSSPETIDVSVPGEPTVAQGTVSAA
jgi:cell division protein FtsQ